MSSTRHATFHALVLRGTDVGETSRLITLFTAEKGRLTVKARGVRSKRSRQAGALEPFTILEAHVLFREGAEIHPFTDGSPLRTPDALRRDPVKAGMAAIWVELLDRVDCDPSDAPRVFDWVGEALDALAQAEEPRGLGLLLAWRLMGLLGHEPRLDRTIDTGEKPKPPLRFSLTLGGLIADPAKVEGDLAIVGLDVEVGRLIWRAGRLAPPELAALKLTPAQRRGLLDLLERFCQFHLDLRLRSPRFLESLEDTA